MDLERLLSSLSGIAGFTGGGGVGGGLLSGLSRRLASGPPQAREAVFRGGNVIAGMQPVTRNAKDMTAALGGRTSPGQVGTGAFQGTRANPVIVSITPESLAEVGKAVSGAGQRGNLARLEPTATAKTEGAKFWQSLKNLGRSIVGKELEPTQTWKAGGEKAKNPLLEIAERNAARMAEGHVVAPPGMFGATEGAQQAASAARRAGEQRGQQAMAAERLRREVGWQAKAMGLPMPGTPQTMASPPPPPKTQHMPYAGWKDLFHHTLSGRRASVAAPGESGGALGGLSSGIGKVAGIIAAFGPPMVKAAVVATKFVVGVLSAALGMEVLGKAAAEQYRDLARFHGGIAMMLAKMDIQKLRLGAEYARATGGTATDMGDAVMTLSKELQPLKNTLGNLKNIGIGALVIVVTKLVQLMDSILSPIMAIARNFGWGTAAKGEHPEMLPIHKLMKGLMGQKLEGENAPKPRWNAVKVAGEMLWQAGRGMVGGTNPMVQQDIMLQHVKMATEMKEDALKQALHPAPRLVADHMAPWMRREKATELAAQWTEDKENRAKAYDQRKAANAAAYASRPGQQRITIDFTNDSTREPIASKCREPGNLNGSIRPTNRGIVNPNARNRPIGSTDLPDVSPDIPGGEDT